MWEILHSSTDPDEKINVAGEEEYAWVVEALSQRIKEKLRGTNLTQVELGEDESSRDIKDEAVMLIRDQSSKRDSKMKKKTKWRRKKSEDSFEVKTNLDEFVPLENNDESWDNETNKEMSHKMQKIQKRRRKRERLQADREEFTAVKSMDSLHNNLYSPRRGNREKDFKEESIIDGSERSSILKWRHDI